MTRHTLTLLFTLTSLLTACTVPGGADEEDLMAVDATADVPDIPPDADDDTAPDAVLDTFVMPDDGPTADLDIEQPPAPLPDTVRTWMQLEGVERVEVEAFPSGEDGALMLVQHLDDARLTGPDVELVWPGQSGGTTRLVWLDASGAVVRELDLGGGAYELAALRRGVALIASYTHEAPPPIAGLPMHDGFIDAVTRVTPDGGITVEAWVEGTVAAVSESESGAIALAGGAIFERDVTVAIGDRAPVVVPATPDGDERGFALSWVALPDGAATRVVEIAGDTDSRASIALTDSGDLWLCGAMFRDGAAGGVVLAPGTATETSFEPFVPGDDTTDMFVARLTRAGAVDTAWLQATGNGVPSCELAAVGEDVVLRGQAVGYLGDDAPTFGWIEPDGDRFEPQVSAPESRTWWVARHDSDGNTAWFQETHRASHLDIAAELAEVSLYQPAGNTFHDMPVAVTVDPPSGEGVHARLALDVDTGGVVEFDAGGYRSGIDHDVAYLSSGDLLLVHRAETDAVIATGSPTPVSCAAGQICLVLMEQGGPVEGVAWQ